MSAAVGRDSTNFPSFSEGLSLRVCAHGINFTCNTYFPSFSEGLSLRVRFAEHALTSQRRFPFLFGGTFIEALCTCRSRSPNHPHFPSFFGRAFIEAGGTSLSKPLKRDFPSFWEGLSLRRPSQPLPNRQSHQFPFLLGRAFIEASRHGGGAPG